MAKERRINVPNRNCSLYEVDIRLTKENCGIVLLGCRFRFYCGATTDRDNKSKREIVARNRSETERMERSLLCIAGGAIAIPHRIKVIT